MVSKITPSQISGEVFAPPSKSYAHRLLIASFLSGEEVVVKGVGDSADVIATLGALESLGAIIKKCDNGVCIKKTEVFGARETYCRESGSTLRFLLPVISALGINSTLTGEKRLMERPLGDLVDTLNKRGADIVGREVRGKLTSGEYKITAGVSSQYITGLLFALPILNGDSRLILDGDIVSKGYIDITLDVLRDFSIEVKRESYGFFIKGDQKYVPPIRDIVVEGDYSGSAFTLALGALSDKGVTVKGLKLDSRQGDRKIVDVLELFGADVHRRDSSVTVRKKELHAIELDCEDIPDLVQIISVVASYAEGESVLRGVDRLRIKESDRVQAVLDCMRLSGIEARYEDNALYIKGGRPHGAVFEGGNDHRTVMSSAVLASRAEGCSEIIGSEAISKSYPSFFEDFKALGGKVDG